MNKIIVEVGSTCTKVDKFDGNIIEKIEGRQYNSKNITRKIKK